MPVVRGKRKTGAAATSKSSKKIQKTQDIRKSLSVLQPAADNPTSLAGSGGSSTSRKIKQQKPLLDCKENSPMKPRRSKRRVAASSCEKSEVKSSTPVSNNTKRTEASTVKQQTLTEYCEKLNAQLKENELVSQQDQEKISEHPKERLSGFSIPSESSGYFSDFTESSFKSDTSVENKLTDAEGSLNKDTCAPPAVVQNSPSHSAHVCDLVSDTLVKNKLTDAEGLLEKDTCAPPEVVQNSPSSSKHVCDLISVKAPQNYWKEVAEQRRLALQEALRENESLHDQIEVMETLNASLKSQVDDAEKLADAVKNILGDS